MTKLNDDHITNALIVKANKDKEKQVDAQFKAFIKDLKYEGPLFALFAVMAVIIVIILLAL